MHDTYTPKQAIWQAEIQDSILEAAAAPAWNRRVDKLTGAALPAIDPSHPEPSLRLSGTYSGVRELWFRGSTMKDAVKLDIWRALWLS